MEDTVVVLSQEKDVYKRQGKTVGAAGLIEIKRRMKSVESTRKITKAMGLVATSKLRKARKELIANEQYNNLCKEVISEVVSSMPEDFDSIYYKSFDGDKLYIVLTSDTGLLSLIHIFRSTSN